MCFVFFFIKEPVHHYNIALNYCNRYLHHNDESYSNEQHLAKMMECQNVSPKIFHQQLELLNTFLTVNFQTADFS